MIPANIEMRSLSTLPACKSVDEVGSSANSSQRESFKKQTTTEGVHHVPFSLKDAELHSDADHKNK